MISKLTFSVLVIGCILVLPGCGSLSAKNTSSGTSTPTSVAPSAPPETPAPIVPTVTPRQPIELVEAPSVPQPTTVPDGALKLRFSSGGVIHEGVLTMDGDSGKLLIRFFDPNSNQTATVEQTIKLKNTSNGLVLSGYDPVYPGTETPYPNYSPDNFLLGVNPDGSKNLKACDDAGICSDIEVIDN